MIVFRAEATPVIGSGHVMRCLSIAQALRARGAACLFVAAGSDAKELVEARGFPYHTLHSDPENPEEELPAFCSFLQRQHADWVIVDSYSVSEAYFKALHEFSRVAYIDDLAVRAYPVDLIVNYNISADAEGYRRLYPPSVRRLLGAAYAPLRDEFQELSCKPRRRCEHLFLSTGGADPLHAGKQLLNAIVRDPRMSGLTAHIVVGAFHPDAESIEAFSREHPNIVAHRHVTRISELMCACDLAVSAAGSTLYELCACGVPSVCYTFADNQLPIARAFSDRQLMRYAGDFRRDPSAAAREILDQIAALCKDFSHRRQLSQRMRQIVDAKGARRIADALLSIQASL